MTSLQSQVHDKSGSVASLLRQPANILIYMRDCQTRLAVLTSTLTQLPARSTSADRPAAPDTAPLPFYLLLLPSSQEAKSDSLCPGGCAPRGNAPHIAATLAAVNAPQTESAATGIPL